MCYTKRLATGNTGVRLLSADDERNAVVANRLKGKALAQVAIVALALGWSAAATTARWKADGQAIEVHAKMPEAGGWIPGNPTAQVGEPLRLRLTSDDVPHGFTVSRTDWTDVDVK
ncbi:MAG TPA: hypothetical protein VLE70_11265, partial [Anaerolineae bacterium]|nr:hypothetical protein [Anaerolineae bacterium]